MSLNLYLLRHAKSSWKQTELSDLERGLNRRGQQSARAMGAALAEIVPVQGIYFSPAQRSRLTLAGLLQTWPRLEAAQHEVVEALYTFDFEDLVDWIRAAGLAPHDVFLIGHNPAFTELINWACGASLLDNLPTAGFVALQLEVDQWPDIQHGCGRLSTQLFPRQLTGGQSTQDSDRGSDNQR